PSSLPLRSAEDISPLSPAATFGVNGPPAYFGHVERFRSEAVPSTLFWPLFARKSLPEFAPGRGWFRAGRGPTPPGILWADPNSGADEVRSYTVRLSPSAREHVHCVHLRRLKVAKDLCLLHAQPLRDGAGAGACAAAHCRASGF